MFRSRRRTTPHSLLTAHFRPTAPSALTVTTRHFVARVRPDLQMALDEIFDAWVEVVHFSGVRAEHAFMGMDFGSLLAAEGPTAEIAPQEYDPVDIGEDKPVNCLQMGFWLLKIEGEPYALLMAPTSPHCGEPPGIRFFLAHGSNAQSQEIAEKFYRRLEQAVAQSRSFRGKVLSLEMTRHYNGHSAGITVHRLAPVKREDLILPDATVELLERNIIGFCQRHVQMKEHGQSVKKGVLFYGPPGTGKTFTIRYLADVLPDHTTLLITAEQVVLLPEYMTLARLLQPSIVVIEDADLIARSRTSMNTPVEEVMLNKLLNEMDGLKEDAQVMFILTTNRPESLEAALASRPGRIDQAIEFPAPDAQNRARLAQIYARDMKLSDEILAVIVERTAGVSASFIKELMRRSLQFWLERNSDEAQIGIADVNSALEEMLFKGGSLNVTLLGGVGAK